MSASQALGSGASKRQQSIDDRGLPPPPVIYGEPLPPFDSNRRADSSPRDTYGLGGRPALREPCRTPGDIMSEHRATSSRNARATSSESAFAGCMSPDLADFVAKVFTSFGEE